MHRLGVERIAVVAAEVAHAVDEEIVAGGEAANRQVVALRTALVLKPGSAEPWTPYRLIQAFIKAGAPPEAFGFYPADHAGAGEILRRCGRGIVFGDVG